MNEPRLSACVVNYGQLLTDEAVLKRIRCPVLGIFGDRDRGIPVEMVRAFENELKRLGKGWRCMYFLTRGTLSLIQTTDKDTTQEAAQKA